MTSLPLTRVTIEDYSEGLRAFLVAEPNDLGVKERWVSPLVSPGIWTSARNLRDALELSGSWASPRPVGGTSAGRV